MDMDGLTAHQHDSFAGQPWPWALKERSQRSEPVGGPQRHSAKCRTSSADLTSIHHRPQLHSTRGGLTGSASISLCINVKLHQRFDMARHFFPCLSNFFS